MTWIINISLAFNLVISGMVMKYLLVDGLVPDLPLSGRAFFFAWFIFAVAALIAEFLRFKRDLREAKPCA